MSTPRTLEARPAPRYLVVTAGTLADLQAQVCTLLAQGFEPTGGPFNASVFAPPFPTVAQAMIRPTQKNIRTL